MIAYDEGFYALQARWILDKGNWIAPLWFDQITLDRTIGVQFLIAISQKIFGENYFATFLPITCASIIMLYLTYLIHKELLDNKFAIISPLILITTYIWINYANMANQDILFAAAVTLGVFSSIKANRTKRNFYYLFCGAWIGIAFMFKTFLTCVPLLAILPFIIQKKIIKNKLFWIGLFIGFLPFLVWTFKIINVYGFEIYNGLFEKLLFLSKKNIFTNPFYYYFWNLPLNIFPWTFLLIPGLINAFKLENSVSKYFLFYYPLTILFFLSLFSTKTPYYPLQILSLFSINIHLGISSILEKRNRFNFFIKFLNFQFLPLLIFITLLLLNLGFIDLNLRDIETKIISLAFLSISIAWLSYNFLKSKKLKILSILLGPYIFFIFIFQSGLISDRTKDLRLASENLIKTENLNEKDIVTVTSGIKDDFSHAMLVKILLQMPKIGDGIESIDNLRRNDYAWSTLSKENLDKQQDIILINDDNIFSPWKLVLKK